MLRNPPRNQPSPVWDLPSLPGLATENGSSCRVYAADQSYPASFYAELKGSPTISTSAQFVPDVEAGNLPTLSFLYHSSPLDEHPPADVTKGMNAVWQAVDAVVRQELWNDCVFMLTYDDWGGFDDHVATPVVEYTPDDVQLAFGPRVPLVLFGGHVRPGIDSRWCSHVSIPKTAIQLLGLPALAVPRLDDDPGLADLFDPNVQNAAPPAFGAQIAVPPAPVPTPPARPLPPPPGPPQPVPEIVLRGGKTLPPPNDVPLPQQPAHPV
jgi:hypothetical protein